MSEQHQPDPANMLPLVAKKNSFLASILKEDNALLAAKLACTKDQVVRLKLCEVPKSESFQQDVDQIAAHLQIDQIKLLELIQQAIRKNT